jgi:acyl-coenzyme A thioesterase PaaI-like protein
VGEQAPALAPVPGCEWCFGCGPDNPFGLHPRFLVETDASGARRVVAQFGARPEHQGFRGLVQGGILTAMLDEVMAHAVWAEGVFAVTGRLEVFFRRPTPIETPLRAEGEVVSSRARVHETRARLLLPDGTVTVEGTGTFVELPEGRFGRPADGG